MTFTVVEHKSTLEDIALGSPYWQRLTIDPQVSLYLEAAKSIGFDVTHVDYDVLRKPQLEPLQATPVEARKYTKPTKKNPVPRLHAKQRENAETPKEFFGRLVESIAEDPDRYYQRGRVVRLEDEAREAQYDVWQTADAIRESRNENVWPRNPDGCMHWSRPCDYLAVCSGVARIDDPMRYTKGSKAHEELKTTDETAVQDGKRRLRLLTQSSIRTFRLCRRKFYYRYEEMWRPLALKAKPLRVGTAIHKGIEAWYRTDGNLTAMLAASETEDPYDLARERAMLTGYHVRWQSPGKVVATEQEFEIDLVNPATGARSRTFRLAGAIDAITEEP